MEKVMYLLFFKLPYTYQQDLPIQLATDVELAKTPFHVLDREDHKYWKKEEFRALIHFILPGYDIIQSVNHCCFRIKAGSKYLSKYNYRTLFFNNLIAFLLWKPLSIHVAGGFTYESEEEPVKEEFYYGLPSGWNPKPEEHYTPQDLVMIKKIAVKLVGHRLLKFKRLINSIILFSHITTGQVRSFQMAYLGLFSVLEGLFWYEGKNKGETLSVRVSNFLSSVEWNHKCTLKDFVQNEYRTRNNITHGGYSVDPKVKLSDEKEKCFGRLHEITRLCILGMLSLDEESLHSIFIQNSEISQKCLDTLEPAKGKFFKGQRLWLNQ